MAKFKTAILILGLLAACIAASLATLLALSLSGAIKAEPAPLIFTVKDETKTFDGEPLTPTAYAMGGELFKGHSIIADFTGSQTFVGESVGGMNVKVVDENGYDVTEEYAVKVNGGKLKVEKSPVLIYLNAGEAVYSGEKYVFDDYTVVAGTLAEGHRPALALPGSGLINAGEVLSGQAAAPAIYDGAGRNVSENYDILFSMGEVKVVARPLAVRPIGGEKVYDGKPLVCDRYEITSGSLVDGHYAKVDFVPVDGEYAAQTFVGEVKVVAEVTVFDANGKDVTRNYAINSEEYATLRVTPRDLVLTAKSRTVNFDGAIHSFAEDSAPYSAVGLVSGESVTVTYGGQIKRVGEVDNVITDYAISGGNGNYNVTLVSGTIRVTPANLTVRLASVAKTYGESIDEFKSLFTFEPELPVGMTFASDIAQSVNSFGEVGSSTYTITDYGVSDEDGNDFTDCFIINVVAGKITVTPRRAEVNVAGGGAYGKTYDGKPFSFRDGDVSATGLLDGHKIDSVVCTEVIDVAEAPVRCLITSVTVRDAFGADVTGNYSLGYSSAFTDVKITARQLTVSTADAEKVYDGAALSGGGIIAAGLAAGDYISQTSVIELTDADSIENKPSYEILNAEGGICSGNYTVTENFGTLTVHAKTVNVTVNGLVKVYGEQVSDEELRGLISGCEGDVTVDKFAFDNFNGCDAGTYVLKPVYDGETQNYKVTVTSGLLVVEKKKIAVRISDGEKEYDGKGITAADIKFACAEAALTLTDSNIIGIKDCGTYRVTASFAVAGGDGANYEISVTGGAFTINKRTVSLTYGGKTTKVYDGAPFVPEFDKINTGFTGLRVTGAEYDEIVRVAQNGNLNIRNPRFALNGEPVSSENFTVNIAPVIVTINKKRVVLKLDNLVVGKDMTDDEIEEIVMAVNPVQAGSLASGDYYDGQYVCSYDKTDCTMTIGTTAIVIKNSAGADVTDCYDFGDDDYIILKVIKV